MRAAAGPPWPGRAGGSLRLPTPRVLTAFRSAHPTAQSSFRTVNSSSTLTTYELTRKCQRRRDRALAVSGRAGPAASQGAP